MRKNIFLIPVLSLFTWALINNSAIAQIIITQADMPVAGLNITVNTDTSTSLSPQNASSTSQTWNYSSLTTYLSNTYFFVQPDSTPYYSSFHSSNLADSLNFLDGYTYFNSAPAAYSETGFVIILYGLTAGVNLHPLFTQIPLPASYGTIDGGLSLGDTTAAISILSYDSGRATVNVRYTDSVDAFGSMTTPYGTENVIRQKHYDKTIDSVFVHSSLTHTWSVYRVTDTIDYQYRWYANGIQYPFVVMQMDTTDKKVVNTQWFDGSINGINEISHSLYTNAYPNPCKTQITFDCSAPSAKYLNIYDVTGRHIDGSDFSGYNHWLMLNTSTYSSGIYLYIISDINGSILDRGKFSIQQ